MHKLDLMKVAKAFGLQTPPAVNLSMFSSTEGKVESRHGFKKRPGDDQAKKYRSNDFKSSDGRQFTK